MNYKMKLESKLCHRNILANLYNDEATEHFMVFSMIRSNVVPAEYYRYFKSTNQFGFNQLVRCRARIHLLRSIGA